MVFGKNVKAVPVLERAYFKRIGMEFAREGVNLAERSCTAIFSAETVDSDGEVVLVDAIDLTRFRKNPVVLLGHYSDSPIGRCSWTKVVEEGGVRSLRGKVVFGRSELAEESWGLVQDGVLSAFSIGMLPESIYRREPNLQESVRWPEVRQIISSCVLLEVSLVACPANGDAVLLADSKGVLKLTRPLLEPTIKAATENKRKPVLQRAPYRMKSGECRAWSKFVYRDDEQQLDPDRMVLTGAYKSADLGPWPHDAAERVAALREIRAMEAGRL